MGDIGKTMSKILVFGGTGYLGQYVVKASILAGHQTYVYVRPTKSGDLVKLQLLEKFQAMGVTIFQGELDEHQKLVKVLRHVDTVIVTLGVPQYMEQLKIIEAMKEAGNIKRFVPSEFGNEVDRGSPLPPFEAIAEKKRKIRRAAEKSGIPYTFVSSNSMGAYFVNFFLHPYDGKNNKVTVYGTGETKFAFTYEKDVAGYTVEVATDPRTENGLVICRLPKNVISQLDLISCWEKKARRTMEKTYISEEEIIKLSQSPSEQDAVTYGILHSIFVKGEQTNYEMTEDDLDVVKLYPEYKYTTVDEVLDIFMVDPPKPVIASFA
ncbi:hypothetical protein ACET3Z_012439 [Daucus carota]